MAEEEKAKEAGEATEAAEAAEAGKAAEAGAAEAGVGALRAAIYAMTPTRVRTAQVLLRLAGAEKSWKGPSLVMTGDDAMDAALRGMLGEAAGPVAAYQAEAAALEEGAVTVDLPKLPFETGALGGAVVSEALEFAENPEKLMEELHRALAPKSKVVLHVRRRRHSLSGALRRWTGLVDPTREAKRAGFTPSELFETLKEGFDVEESVGYGRFFTECAEWLAELFAGLMPQTCEAGALDAGRLKRAGKVYRAFKPLFALSKALDGLCFFLPTHHWAVRAKRRLLWAPRIAPRLRDGRTLADAVLGGKIGTAVGQ